MLAISSSPLIFSRKSGQFHWISFFLVSALLHIILAIMMQKQVKIGAESFSTKPKEVKALSTYLVSMPKPTALKSSAKIIPPEFSPVVEYSVNKEKLKPLQNEVLVKPNEADTRHNNSLVQTQVGSTKEDKLDSNSEFSDAPVSNTPQKLQSFTEGYFKRLNQSASNGLAKGESRLYHINKNRVKLPKKSELSFEQQYGLGNPKPVVVDCSSGIKKGLVALATLTGGRVGCLSNPKIQSFIDLRLKKQSTDRKGSENSKRP